MHHLRMVFSPLTPQCPTIDQFPIMDRQSVLPPIPSLLPECTLQNRIQNDASRMQWTTLLFLPFLPYLHHPPLHPTLSPFSFGRNPNVESASHIRTPSLSRSFLHPPPPPPPASMPAQHLAAAGGQDRSLLFLLERDANPNTEDASPLFKPLPSPSLPCPHSSSPLPPSCLPSTWQQQGAKTAPSSSSWSAAQTQTRRMPSSGRPCRRQ